MPPSELPKARKEPGTDTLSGKRAIGDYELQGQLGRGGMGVVYRARQVSLNRTVAVKMLLNSALSSPAMVRRFEIEAETVARLDHPHIVPIYEVREEDGQRYFSMKLIEGESLAQQIRRKEFQPQPAGKVRKERTWSQIEQRIVSIMVTTSRAVHYAHEKGVLHRDLKPANILIDVSGEPHLTDFGLAKIDADKNLTASDTLLGTPCYMAPEQATGGRASVATDVYSLGAIFYELLTSRPPFEGTTPVETLRRVVDEEPTPAVSINRQIDRDLLVICSKAMEKDPLRRYATAAGLADDLERWLRHEPIRARSAGAWLRTNRWMRRNRMGTALIFVLCLGLTACSVLLRVVAKQKEAEQRGLNILRKTISNRVADLPTASRPFEYFSAEELKILLGRNSTPKPGAARFVVATFIDQSPMQTLIMFGKIIDRIESSLPATLHEAVSLDLRIYKDAVALRDDLAKGAVHFASIDGTTCLAAQALQPEVRALVCDSRPGLPAVIFVPARSTITNLAGLKGHSLALSDATLFPVGIVFAQLAEAGLCTRDIQLSLLGDRSPQAGERRIAMRKTHAGWYGQQSNARQAVLKERSSDAGVALTRALASEQEGVQWRRLATFLIPDFLWVAGPNVDASTRDAFTHVLIAIRNPQELESAVVDTDSPGFAYTNATDKYLEALRAAKRAESRFQQCLPLPDGEATNQPTIKK